VSKPDTIDAFIEIPANSSNKYEYDDELGAFRLSRVMFPSVRYPVNYGFVPGTRAGDGDRLDIMVLSDEPILRGTVLAVRPVAVLCMSDQKGQDEKILAVPGDDPHFDSVRECRDIPPNRLHAVELFFRLYRLPDSQEEVQIDGWEAADEAWRLIRECAVSPTAEDAMFRGAGSPSAPTAASR